MQRLLKTSYKITSSCKFSNFGCGLSKILQNISIFFIIFVFPRSKPRIFAKKFLLQEVFILSSEGRNESEAFIFSERRQTIGQYRGALPRVSTSEASTLITLRLCRRESYIKFIRKSRSVSYFFTKLTVVLFSYLLPSFVYAAAEPETFKLLLQKISNEILTPLIPFIFGLALLGFLWGAAQFIFKADNEEARKKGSQKMIYGIIALFVMISVWGLVKIITTTFGVQSVMPQLQAPTSR